MKERVKEHIKPKFRNDDINDLKFNDVSQTFDDQLKEFLDKILLNDFEFGRYYKPVGVDLYTIFLPIFPKCVIKNFGSTATYLGFKKCDLDIHLSSGFPTSGKDKILGPHIVSSKKLFNFVLSVLLEYPDVFTRVIPIPAARIPIIKFVHRGTRVSCDISFKNCIGVYNTELIKYYISMDIRVKQLLVILRYWLGRTPKKIPFTKYALSMLIIFYLQQIKLIPTVMELQKNCKVPLTVNGWQVNIQKTRFYSTSHYKDRCLPELIQDFFEFYKNYDFDSYVISPFDGQSHKKTKFIEYKNLPDSMSRYRENIELKIIDAKTSQWDNKLCLQDPFELNINLGHVVKPEQLEMFKNYAYLYANTVKESSKKSYKNLFKNLFDAEKISPLESPKKNPKMIENISFIINPKEFLELNMEEVIQKDFFLKNKWFSIIFENIQRYFEDVLKFEININYVDKPVIKSKSESSENKSVILIYCKGDCCLWSGRKKFKAKKQASPLEKEIEISKSLITTKEMTNTLNTKVDFKCSIMKLTEPTCHISLLLTNFGCVKSEFNKLGDHLMQKMTSVLKRQYTHLCQQKKNPKL